MDGVFDQSLISIVGGGVARLEFCRRYCFRGCVNTSPPIYSGFIVVGWLRLPELGLL